MIGIDIGGTKIEAVLLDKNFKIIKKTRLPTGPRTNKEKVIKNILKALKSVDDNKSSIGIGFPGIVDKGKIIGSQNITILKGYNLKSRIEKETKRKVLIDNDANCFTIAETKIGSAKGAKNVVGITIGTGIGGGIISEGELLHGFTGGAGEVGKIILDVKKNLTFEDLCSGTGITKRYKDLGGKIDNPDPKKIYYSKERLAKDIFSEFIDIMGTALASIATTLNPEVIVIGGGVSNLPIINDLKKSFKKHAKSKTIQKVTIKNSQIKASGAIGAALLHSSRTK